MGSVSVRCQACGAALHVPPRVRLVTCEACGRGLAVMREGGAVFTEVDHDVGHDVGRDAGAARPARASEPGGAPPGRGSRLPSPGAALVSGAATVAGGLAWMGLTLGEGLSILFPALGGAVATAGAAAVAHAGVRAARDRRRGRARFTD